MSETITVTAEDGTSIHTYRWLPEGEPKAIVQVAHGMAEHAARYDRFARALAAAGYAVYANDHRGHGETGGQVNHGFLADEGGAALVEADMAAVMTTAREAYPDVPVVLFGHSMGSFFARAFAANQAAPIDALILSGTAGDPGPLAKVGRLLATGQAKVRGKRHTSGLLDKLTFSENNKKFKPARTAFDWLSRDEAEVDAYVADPLCGQVFSAGFYVDLLDLLAEVVRPEAAAAVPNEVPVLVFSGDQDPVGAFGIGVTATAAQYRDGGSQDVTLTLYPGGRHEMLNETNRDEVTADIITWLEQRTGV